MKIKFNNRDPVYVQVIRHFKEQMATGVIEPGQEIPSRRELANQLKINPNTAQRAYKEMEEEGLIFTEGNLPSRMTTDEKVFQAVRSELILEAVDAFVNAVRTINVPLDEVLPIIEQKYKKECNE
ncbi:GntR family transcriptional regulator [Robertmurraya siralis]|uniref:GntR family transcriptional regulator n=1 Tax=Robertmurraya siralis TaxID=77777 RepID=A0A919WHT6_9BACI|nr:GntR family transcriptional regulator [Robertmurraya siralis]PAE20274.1 GntR family transcriptional regulator [Bacillus sp. 7504-2]GIN62200.1 GntR family transcriptional regulator [Robertmurraya siralis]